MLNKAYSNVHINKNSSDIPDIHNGLKYGGVSTSLLYNFALEYAITNFQTNQESVRLNRIH